MFAYVCSREFIFNGSVSYSIFILRWMKWLLTSWLGNDQLASEAVRAQLLADGVWVQRNSAEEFSSN